MPALIVLADANVLVKDVVSYAFFDLAKSALLDLRWTPQIEVEYARHRARLRAQASGRETSFEDLVWAQKTPGHHQKVSGSWFPAPGLGR